MTIITVYIIRLHFNACILHFQTFQDCFGRHPENYILYFIPEPENENEKCERTFRCGPLKEQNLQSSCNAIAEELPLDCWYNVTIESVNDAGRTNSTGIIPLSKLSDNTYLLQQFFKSRSL